MSAVKRCVSPYSLATDTGTRTLQSRRTRGCLRNGDDASRMGWRDWSKTQHKYTMLALRSCTPFFHLNFMNENFDDLDIIDRCFYCVHFVFLCASRLPEFVARSIYRDCSHCVIASVLCFMPTQHSAYSNSFLNDCSSDGAVSGVCVCARSSIVARQMCGNYSRKSLNANEIHQGF